MASEAFGALLCRMYGLIIEIYVALVMSVAKKNAASGAVGIEFDDMRGCGVRLDAIAITLFGHRVVGYRRPEKDG